MSTSTYTVSGMSCGHCVSAVRAEIGQIVGVTAVAVDLTGGRVTVISRRPVAGADIRAAVEEAGYELAGVTSGR